MPTSPKYAGPPTEPSDTVAISTTVGVPRRFSQTYTSKLDDDRVAVTVVYVVMSDDGRPLLERFEFHAPRDGLRPDELRRPDLKGWLQWAFTTQVGRQLLTTKLEAEGVHGESVSYLQMSDDEVDELAHEARSLSRPRGPYRVTDQFLADVVALNERGGVALVVKECDTSERTARRWLHQARDRGLS